MVPGWSSTRPKRTPAEPSRPNGRSERRKKMAPQKIGKHHQALCAALSSDSYPDLCTSGKTQYRQCGGFRQRIDSQRPTAFGRHAAQCDICSAIAIAADRIRRQSSGLPTPRTMWEDWMNTSSRRRAIDQWNRRQSALQNAASGESELEKQ